MVKPKIGQNMATVGYEVKIIKVLQMVFRNHLIFKISSVYHNSHRQNLPRKIFEDMKLFVRIFLERS